jgi:Ca2+-binding RTX toxin-like protein
VSDFAPWSTEGNHSPTRTDLAIDVAGTGTQARGTITVQHWQEGQLGLSLGGTVQSTGVHTLSGGNDFTDRGGAHGVPLAATVVRGQGGHDVVRAGASAHDTKALQLYGEQGNDIVFGNARNDVIDGGEDNDFLSGSGGCDVIMAGAGSGVLTVNDLWRDTAWLG